MGWSLWPTRAGEATPAQVVATGAWAGSNGGVDPIDGDSGYKAASRTRSREVPYWTREKAAAHSVAAYRSNPMATAIVDTYTSFCVGDSGVKTLCTSPQVAEVVDEFWTDPANRIADLQTLWLRSQILVGEQLTELLTGPQSGAVRFSPIDPTNITDIHLRSGNPLWPAVAVLGTGPSGDGGTDTRELSIAQVDDATGLRTGQAMFWAPWKTLNTDVRGMPMLTTSLDWLDSYDLVLSNLIDRTALARYLVMTVEVQGGQAEVDAFVTARGGTHMPASGTVEVHNQDVAWKPVTAQTGAYEDAKANQSVLTSVAAGAGLAKTWLAEPEDANRATSLTMAEPVRRRVGGVQQVWLSQMTELTRYQVDRAVAAKRLPATVTSVDARTGQYRQVPASQAVTVTGPQIAASDSQLTAQVLLNLSTGLEKLQQIGALSPEAAAVAAQKAWEDYVGVPYRAELAKPGATPDDVATAVDDAKVRKLRPAQ